MSLHFEGVQILSLFIRRKKNLFLSKKEADLTEVCVRLRSSALKTPGFIEKTCKQFKCRIFKGLCRQTQVY